MAKKPKKRRIIGGVDTHADTHHAAVVLMNGRRLADREFSATTAGYEALLEWMRGFGRLHAVGVEGTGSYGAALAEDMLKAAPDALRISKRTFDATLEIPSFDAALEVEERGQIQAIRAGARARELAKG